MSDKVSLDELKEKFNTLQNVSQGLKEDKIRLESELSTLESRYTELVDKLLESTGTSSVEEASEYYRSRREECNNSMETCHIFRYLWRG